MRFLLRLVTWPPLAATVLGALIEPLLQGRYHLLSATATIVLTIVGFVVAIASAVAHEYRRANAERVLSLVVVMILSLLTINAIVRLTDLLLHAQLSSGPLLQSAIALWLSNTFTFSLWYWYIDGHDWRGRMQASPDFMFPQPPSAPVGSVVLNYFDYLFLAFNTATAFSPTDVVPVTTRARLLMMCESAVSLATVAIVAARAVNLAS